MVRSVKKRAARRGCKFSLVVIIVERGQDAGAKVVGEARW
jgi:hypothetical protein